MTQAELDILAEQKARATKILQGIVGDKHAMEHTYWLMTEGTDHRLVEYVEHVAYHPEMVGIKEQLAVIRYFRMCRTYTYYPDIVKMFIRWGEVTPQEGKSKRECYKMTPHEVFLSAVIFGFWIRNEHGELCRFIRTLLLLVARKYNKTGFAALLGSFFFYVYGDDNAEIYFAANSAPQAKKGYNECKKQLSFYDPHCYDKNSKKQRIRATEDEISWKPRKGSPHRFIQRLTGNVDTKDGFNPQFAHIDELHADRDLPSKPGGALLNVLESGMGARKDPLILITSTAGRYTDAILARMCKTYTGILLKELDCPLWRDILGDSSSNLPLLTNDQIDNLVEEGMLTEEQASLYWEIFGDGYHAMQDMIFPMMCQPDEGDDITDPNTWAKAQPHLGITVYKEFYESCLAKAHTDHTFYMEFFWKNLNLFMVDESTAWFTLEQANQLMDKEADFFRDVTKMGDCVCAVDLMEVGDMCAVCYFGYDIEAHRFRAHLEYYMPEDSIDTHPNKFLYREWAEQGYLNLTKGKVLDGDYVADEILRAGVRMDGHLKRIRYDAAYSRDFANRLKMHDGIPPECVLPVPQTILNYTQAMQYFDIIRDDPQMGGIVIDYNPILAWNLCNCVLLVNHNGLRMPDKGRGAENKIDGADALLMCVFDAQEQI